MAWPNGIGLTATFHSYEDQPFIAFSPQKVLHARPMVEKTLRYAGFAPVETEANFVFVHISPDAQAFREAMGRAGVLLNGGYAGYPTYIRVSMGKLEDLEVFDRVFKRVIARA